MTFECDLAVWLYGSHARGDADEFSDLDILVVSERETDALQIRQLVGTSVTTSISCYAWSEIEQMARYGSLFLRHVELEGRPIFESAPAEGKLGHILSGLGPYQLASRDLQGFRTVLRDVGESLGYVDTPLIFELSTLGTVFRHASILGCALAESPCFSRNEPVARLVARWDLSRSWAANFASLYVFRLYADGRLSTCPAPSLDTARLWCQRAHELLDELGRRINDPD